MPKERPIIFSDDMVRAILAGRKTQTRRVVKPQPSPGEWIGLDNSEPPLWFKWWGPQDESAEPLCVVKRPWEPGMRLWVRACYTTQYDRLFDHTLWRCCAGQEPRFFTTHGRAISRAGKPMRDGKWPARAMPRWLSEELRLPILEIKSVRVELLQEISQDDAMAEGMEGYRIYLGHGDYREVEPVEEFAEVWDRINGDKPGLTWEDNPWVWVIEFEKQEPPDAN